MKHRILIIDDDECSIGGLRLYLESNGFIVDYAADGDHGNHCVTGVLAHVATRATGAAGRIQAV